MVRTYNAWEGGKPGNPRAPVRKPGAQTPTRSCYSLDAVPFIPWEQSPMCFTPQPTYATYAGSIITSPSFIFVGYRLFGALTLETASNLAGRRISRQRPLRKCCHKSFSFFFTEALFLQINGRNSSRGANVDVRSWFDWEPVGFLLTAQCVLFIGTFLRLFVFLSNSRDSGGKERKQTRCRAEKRRMDFD